jgi:hypothetical protein
LKGKSVSECEVDINYKREEVLIERNIARFYLAWLTALALSLASGAAAAEESLVG